jgi:hypothetical protein
MNKRHITMGQSGLIKEGFGIETEESARGVVYHTGSERLSCESVVEPRFPRPSGRGQEGALCIYWARQWSGCGLWRPLEEPAITALANKPQSTTTSTFPMVRGAETCARGPAGERGPSMGTGD